MATTLRNDAVEIIARFAVGQEVCEGNPKVRVGEVQLVQREDDGAFIVFVVGGLLPSGQAQRRTPDFRQAFAIFGNVVTQMLADEARDWA
jgi:hypothetical protein